MKSDDQSGLTADFSHFAALDIRVGTVVKARIFEEAKKPAIQLWIDFGELGIKQSSAQITVRYSVDTLVGTQVVGVVNFAPKRIAGFVSECLVLGALGRDESDVVLLRPDVPVEPGSRIA
jgi:tRNA-binding protein